MANLAVGSIISFASINRINPPFRDMPEVIDQSIHRDERAFKRLTCAPSETVECEFRPLNDMAVIQLEPDPDMVGMLYIPESEVIFSYWATVLAVGPGKLITKGPNCGQRLPMAIKPGDIVFYHKIDEWADESRRIAFMKEENCIMVAEGDRAPVSNPFVSRNNG